MSGRSMLFLLTGMAAGAGVMYILDPAVGRRRRALARDKMVSTMHDAEHVLEQRSRDLRNRAMGAIAELRSRMRERFADDDVLLERVRSELGRVCSHPREVDVLVNDGNVTLNGGVLGNEFVTTSSAIESVPGVRKVINNLRTFETAESFRSV